jgi:hypothetical protein
LFEHICSIVRIIGILLFIIEYESSNLIIEPLSR